MQDLIPMIFCAVVLAFVLALVLKGRDVDDW